MRGCYLVVVVSVLGFMWFRLGCLDKPDYLAVTAESMYDARLCSADKIMYGTFPWEISTQPSPNLKHLLKFLEGDREPIQEEV